MAPKFGGAIFTSVLSAFQLPKRICSEWLQKSNAAFSLLFYQHSRSQRGSAIHYPKVRSQHFHFCFISTPAPREGLQLIIPKFGRTSKPLYFTVLQLLERIYSSSFQSSVAPLYHCVLQCSSSQRRSAVRVPNCGRTFKTIVFYSVPAPREDLQRVIPYRAVHQNHCILQCSSSQRGSAVHFSTERTPHVSAKVPIAFCKRVCCACRVQFTI